MAETRLISIFFGRPSADRSASRMGPRGCECDAWLSANESKPQPPRIVPNRSCGVSGLVTIASAVSPAVSGADGG